MSRFKINNSVSDEKVGRQSIKEYNPRQFTKIPEGIYDCKVDMIEVDNYEKDKENFRVTFKVLEGDNKNTSIFQYFEFDSDNEKKVYVHKRIYNEMLTSLGFTTDECNLIRENFVKYAFAMIDKNIRIKIIHREVGDKTYVNIDKLLKCFDNFDNGENLIDRYNEKNKRMEKLMNSKEDEI